MRNFNRARFLACLAAQVITVSLFAQETSSHWVAADPAGAVSKDNPATVDRIQFGNQFQNQGMDQGCDRLPLVVPLSQDFVNSVGQGNLLTGGTFSGTRQFLRYPDGSLALNDQLDVKFQMGYSRTLIEALGGTAQKALGVYGGVSINGESIVTRPLHTANSCGKMKRLLNVRDFKTVLPLNAQRISKMEIGELWEIPLVYQVSFEPLDAAESLTTPLRLAPAAAYLSIGLSKVSDPTVTLFRRGPHELRLKIHFDQFKTVNASGGAIIGPIPATDIGTPGVESLLSTLLPNLITNPFLELFTRQIDDYLAIQLSVLMTGERGHQIFLEYRLDPSDPDQMRRLAKLLKGDLGILKEMKDFLSDWSDDPKNLGVQKDLQQRYNSTLHVPERIAGLDSYKNSFRSLSFSIPFLLNYTGSRSNSDDHYVIESPSHGDLRSYKAQRQSNWGFFKPPVLGSSLRRDRSQSVQVLLLTPPASVGSPQPVPEPDISLSKEMGMCPSAASCQGNFVNGPLVVYNRESGVLRSGSIGQEINRINSLVSSIGSLDSPIDPSLELPNSLRDLARGQNHKGYLELSILLTPQAVNKILSASAVAVIKAFQGSLEGVDREIFDYALRYSKILSDGTIEIRSSFSSHLDELRLPDSASDKLSMAMSSAEKLCHQAKLIVEDLNRAYSLGSSPDAQAKALFQILTGTTHRFGKSSGYDAVMNVLLRLAPRDGVAADIVLHVDKKKTRSSDPSQRYLLNPSILNSTSLRSMSGIERAFMPPTPLND